MSYLDGNQVVELSRDRDEIRDEVERKRRLPTNPTSRSLRRRGTRGSARRRISTNQAGIRRREAARRRTVPK
jgi:hypothetical protein